MRAAVFLLVALGATPSFAAAPKVQTMVSRQAALGITPDQFIPETMYAIERELLKKMRSYAVEKMDVVGADRLVEENTGAASVILEVDDQRLIVTKVRVEQHKPFVQVTGIKNDQWIRVLCMVDVDADVSLVGNDCERVIEKTFSIQIPGGSVND